MSIKRTGKAQKSFTSVYLDQKGTPTEEEEELIKAAAASLYSGMSRFTLHAPLRLITFSGGADTVCLSNQSIRTSAERLSDALIPSIVHPGHDTPS